MVSKNKNGWYDISFQILIKDGKKIHIHRRNVSKSKKEAKKIEQRMRDEHKGIKHTLTLLEVYDERNKDLINKGKSIGTTRSYDSLVANHIKPFLKNKNVNKYTFNDIEKYIDELHAAGRSNNTINKCTSLLKALFNYSIKKHYMSAVNPLMDIGTLSTVKRKKPYYFTYNEFIQFIEVVREIEDDPNLWECIWTTLYELGIRKSELEPIKVSDINFEHMTISINKHMAEGHGKKEILDGRKNGDGYEAPISDKLANLIKKRIKNLQKFDGYSKNSFLFNELSVFNPVARSTLKRHLDAACVAGGFEPTTPHSFRHMCCSNLIDLGADVFTIATHIGDTVEMVEKVYGKKIKARRYARNLINQQNSSIGGANDGK